MNEESKITKKMGESIAYTAQIALLRREADLTVAAIKTMHRLRGFKTIESITTKHNAMMGDILKGDKVLRPFTHIVLEMGGWKSAKHLQGRLGHLLYTIRKSDDFPENVSTHYWRDKDMVTIQLQHEGTISDRDVEEGDDEIE